MPDARVPGFVPSVSGFHFANRAVEPPILVPFPGAMLPVGLGPRGVCAGMVCGALDFFSAGREIPPNVRFPSIGTPLRTYILERELVSWVQGTGLLSNVGRLFDYISLLDHDTVFGGRGLSSFTVLDETPRIVMDIDAGRPSPVILIAGSWVWPTNIKAKVLTLTRCHAVLAYAYVLDAAQNLTLSIYNPNQPNVNDSTITLNLSTPAHTTAITAAGVSAGTHNAYRGYLRLDYVPIAPPAGLSSKRLPPMIIDRHGFHPALGRDADKLQAEQELPPGHALNSPSREFTLVYQPDGNLVLYRHHFFPLWESGTARQRPGTCVMEDDGNLSIYDSHGSKIWSSGIAGAKGSYLVVQDDGNVVILALPDLPVWATQTSIPRGPRATGHAMFANQILDPGDTLTSTNQRYFLTYQADGNLVLYDTDLINPIWSTDSYGTVPGTCIMQDDGNLVIYEPGPKPIWATGPKGHMARLTLNDDGTLTMVAPGPGHVVVWQAR